MKCTCGHPDNYNYAIDNGLCNSCIENLIDGLRDAVAWMLADIDYRKEGTGIACFDSPEVKKARRLLNNWDSKFWGDE